MNSATALTARHPWIHRPLIRHALRPRRLRRLVAGLGTFYVFTAGINVGLTLARPTIFVGFADAALFDGVRVAWAATFDVHPPVYGFVLAAGELAIAVALLAGRRTVKAGLLAVIAFHLALMLFGWGFWLWSVPALVLVTALAGLVWRDDPYRPSPASAPAEGHGRTGAPTLPPQVR